jgi:hypothetical protein
MYQMDPVNAPSAFLPVLQHVLVRALFLNNATADNSAESVEEDEVLACLGDDPLVVSYACLLARLLISNSKAGIGLLESQSNPQQTLIGVTACGVRWSASMSRPQVRSMCEGVISMLPSRMFLPLASCLCRLPRPSLSTRRSVLCRLSSPIPPSFSTGAPNGCGTEPADGCVDGDGARPVP